MNGRRRILMERILAVALLVGGVLVIGAVTVGTAYLAFDAERRRAADAKLLLHRLQAVVDRQQAFASQLTAGGSAGVDGVFLTAPTRAAAAAELQERVGALAARSGTTVNRLAPAGGGGDTRIAVAVQVAGDLISMSTFLVALDRQQPWLFVDTMRLTQPAARRPRPADPANPDYIGLFTISAYTGPGERP